MYKSYLTPSTEASDRRQEETRLCLAAAEWLLELMAAKRVDQSEVARRLGCSKGHISQLLSGDHNMTLRTLASFAWALGERVDLVAESEPQTMRWRPTSPYTWSLPTPAVRRADAGTICIAA